MTSINIAFAGDFAPIHDLSLADIKIDSQLKQKLQNHDFFFLNLEAPITEKTKKRLKAGVNLKIASENVLLLQKLNVNGVSLANNHIFDYEEQGVFDTIEKLDKSNINYWGIGENKVNAYKPYIFEKDDLRIAIVSYAEHEFNWISDERWCTSMLDPAANVIQIIELSKKVDHVIVFTHIGPENWHYPSPRQVTLFRNFIEAGASAVLNSHSHTIMGMEWYKDSPIYYSLGNFFFPSSNSNEEWCHGLIVELTVHNNDKKVESKEIPVHFSKATLTLNKKTKNFKQSFQVLSENLNDYSFVQRQWDEFGKQEQKKLTREIIKGLTAIILGACLGPFSKRFRTIKTKGFAIIRGYTNCENHIENIGNLFNFKLNSQR